MVKKLLLILFVPLLAFSQDLKLSPLSVNTDLLQGSDSVLRHEEITLDLSDEGTLKTSIYRVVTVFNKSGLSDVHAYAGYDNNSKVLKIEAIVYDLTGDEKEKIKKRDFKDVSAVAGGTLYADNRFIYLDYTPTTYPFTISFTSETVSETTAFIRPWMPVTSYDSGTEFSQFTIIHNPTDSLHVKATNLEGYDISKVETPEKTVWTAKNISPVTWEYKSPDLDKRMPVIRCYLDAFYLTGVPGIGGNWKDFGKWMYKDLVKDTQDLDPAAISEIRTLTENLPDDEAKARAVYQYVQDKVRYISVQVEIGGWKPMNASDVHRLSYGDCKALSNYTQSLLEAVGVKSYYTVLYGDSGKESLDEDVIAMQGNHVILGVQLGDEVKFLECTSQETPFGYMGTFTDDRDVLLLTEDGGEIAHTTKYNQDDNLETIEATLILDAAGNLSGAINRSSKGIFYSKRMGLERKDEKDLKDYYYETWDVIHNLLVTNIQLDNNREAVDYTEQMQFEAQSYASKINEDFLIKANPFGYSRGAIPPRYSDRKAKFVVLRGTTEKEKIEIEIPEGFIVNSLPEAVNVDGDFGSYTANFKVEDQRVFYTRTLKLNEGTYPVASYESYREFYKEIIRLDSQKLLIEKR